MCVVGQKLTCGRREEEDRVVQSRNSQGTSNSSHVIAVWRRLWIPALHFSSLPFCSRFWKGGNVVMVLGIERMEREGEGGREREIWDEGMRERGRGQSGEKQAFASDVKQQSCDCCQEQLADVRFLSDVPYLSPLSSPSFAFQRTKRLTVWLDKKKWCDQNLIWLEQNQRRVDRI